MLMWKWYTLLTRRLAPAALGRVDGRHKLERQGGLAKGGITARFHSPAADGAEQDFTNWGGDAGENQFS
jgi:hypothetical protein